MTVRFPKGSHFLILRAVVRALPSGLPQSHPLLRNMEMAPGGPGQVPSSTFPSLVRAPGRAGQLDGDGRVALVVNSS